jgi:hypothetical protein
MSGLLGATAAEMAAMNQGPPSAAARFAELEAQAVTPELTASGRAYEWRRGAAQNVNGGTAQGAYSMQSTSEGHTLMRCILSATCYTYNVNTTGGAYIGQWIGGATALGIASTQGDPPTAPPEVGVSTSYPWLYWDLFRWNNTFLTYDTATETNTAIEYAAPCWTDLSFKGERTTTSSLQAIWFAWNEIGSPIGESHDWHFYIDIAWSVLLLAAA